MSLTDLSRGALNGTIGANSSVQRPLPFWLRALAAAVLAAFE